MPLKGLDAIRDSLTARAAAGSPSTGGVPELAIVSGEVALIHFLTDRNDIIEVRYHRIPETLTSGKVITRERLCRQEVGESCSYDSHPSDDLRRTTLRWWSWVYVYCILTPHPVPGAEQVTRGARTLNVWKLGEPAILKRGEGNNKYIVQMLLSHSERYGTLCDRIYEWERTGSGRQDTSYFLAPMPDIASKPEIAFPQALEEIIAKELSLSSYPVRMQQQQSAQPAGPSLSGAPPWNAPGQLQQGQTLQSSETAPQTQPEPGSSVSKLMDLLKGGSQNQPKL